MGEEDVNFQDIKIVDIGGFQVLMDFMKYEKEFRVGFRGF